jgi:hypothetical protein
MHSQNDVRIATLVDAYLSADYRWELDRQWRSLQVGQLAPGIEAAFPEAASFGLLSAWDPHSTPRPEATNRAADEALHTALLASGLAFRPGFSSAPNRSWREPSWVVMDMPEDEFDRLARRFAQLAGLRWTRGEPVRLRMYARRPVLSAPHDCVDWIETVPAQAAEGGVRDPLSR